MGSSIRPFTQRRMKAILRSDKYSKAIVDWVNNAPCTGIITLLIIPLNGLIIGIIPVIRRIISSVNYNKNLQVVLI